MKTLTAFNPQILVAAILFMLVESSTVGPIAFTSKIKHEPVLLSSISYHQPANPVPMGKLLQNVATR